MSPVGIDADLCLGRNAPPYAQTDPFLRRGPQFEHTYNFQGYMSTLESYLEALEDERQKIEAFKRELPFCMRLLDEAIETSREQLANRLTSSLGQPLQLTCNSIDSANLRKNKLTNEEFVLLKRKRNKLDESSEDEEQQSKRTNQWMETPGERAPARRGADWPWNPATLQRKQEELPLTRRVRDCEIAKSELEYSDGNVANVIANCKEKTKGAFSPYGRELLQQSGKDNVNCVDSSTGKEVSQVSRASKGDLGVNDTVGSRPGEVIESQKEGALPPTGSARTTSAQPQRKARRCWSPELHQRFLSALEQLGGSQVATPKQIRELMNVEGLTNDEVKSHLQKFRLHMRRPNSASQVEAQQGHHLVVFGGIWVPPEYGSHAPATAAGAPPHQQSLDQLYIEAPPAHQKHNLNPPPLLPKDFFSQRSSSSPPPAAPPLLQNSAYQDYKQGSPIYHRLMLDNSAVRYASSGDQGGGESGSEEEGERSESRGMVNGRRQAETRIEEEHEDEEGEEEEEDSSEIQENSKKLKRLTDLHHEEEENRYNSRRSSRLAASPAKMGPCAMARRLASSTELNMGGSIAASS